VAKSRKTARKTSSKRSSSKRSSPKARGVRRATRATAGRGVNLKKIREDLVRAIAAMKKSPAALEARAAFDSSSDQAELEEMVARINDYCERDRRCGPTMIIPT
jgi:hypothetical protein